MKLEGIVLAAIVLAAMGNACASGATDSPSHGGGGTGGAAENGSGGSSGFGGSAGSGGAGGSAGAYGTTDSGSPYTAPDTGAPIYDAGSSADSVVISPFDAGVTYEGGIDPACSTMGTLSACAECCGTGEPSGVDTLNAAIQACACGASGACATECASEVCVSVPASEGDACYTCLSAALAKGGSCDAPVQTTCMADPSCSAYLSCESAECSSLP